MRKRSYTSQKAFGASERADREIGDPRQRGCPRACGAVQKFKSKRRGRVSYTASIKRRAPCDYAGPARAVNLKSSLGAYRFATNSRTWLAKVSAVTFSPCQVFARLRGYA